MAINISLHFTRVRADYHGNVNRRTFLAVLCAAGVCAAQTVPEHIAAHLRAENLKADVAFLASDALRGRATPSPGLDAAAEYIASQFRKAGLEPVGEDGYFQTATYVIATPNLEGLELSAGGVKATSIAVQEAVATDLKDAPVLKLSPNDLDSIAADQVKGKVLVIDVSDANLQVQRRVLASLAKFEPTLAVLLRTTAPPSARVAMREASAPAPKTAIVTVWDAPVRDALAAPDAKVSVHIAAPKTETVKARNVVGLLRGSDPVLKDTYILVTGHYDHLGVRGSGPGDHIYNGANDDASGTSSVIEIGAALAALTEKPRRSILFMTVFGEETGGYGSRFYAAHPIFPVAKTVADINLEQLGRTDDSEGPKQLQFNLTGFDYTDIAATMAKAGTETGIQIVKHEKNSDAFFSRSDNAKFADIGIPSTTVSVAYVFPDYHQPGDEWPKLDYDNMAKVDTCIALGIWNIATSDKAPEWNRENPKVKQYIEAREKSQQRSIE
jgi:Peptidase family M28